MASEKSLKIPSPADLSVCNGPSVAAPISCYNHKDIINITVKDGESTKVYGIFRGLLAWHSSYFAAALDSSNELFEVKDDTLELEEDISVFDAFYCWLYTSQLKGPITPEDATTPQPLSENDVYLSVQSSKIWIFADFRGIPALGNAAMNMLHERIATTWKSPNETIKYVYENTTKGSKLRDLYVQIFVRGSRLQGILNLNPELFTVEFLLELLPVFAEAKGLPAPIMQEGWTRLNRCQWHDHSGPGGKLRLESRK